MPGWGYGDYAGIDPTLYMGVSGQSAFSSQEPKFKCQNCVDCGEDDEDKSRRCCGCVCMRCAFAFADIPYCSECDQINPPNEVSWPGPYYSLSARGEADEKHIEDRAGNKVNAGRKQVKVCGTYWSGVDNYRYPSFPQDVTKNWATMDKKREKSGRL